MRMTTILTTADEFTDKIERCCRDYKSLHIAVAWRGNPNTHSPINTWTTSMVKSVGRSFNQTHPAAIQWLLKKASTLRVFREENRSKSDLLRRLPEPSGRTFVLPLTNLLQQQFT